jgi:opacity protein-like surface antigen
MRFKLAAFPLLAVSFLTIAVSAFSQVVPSYERKSGWPFTVGAGPVNYDVDMGHGRMYGFAGWFDIYPGKLPSILHGHLGAEGELRHISLGASSSQQRNLYAPQPPVRYDTAAMGLIYIWHRLHNIRPYAKIMIGDGSVDFLPLSKSYAHDTRTFTAPGGGIEFRIKQDLWVRANYDYERWQSLAVYGNLKPQGFTLGASYDFTRPFLLKNRQ